MAKTVQGKTIKFGDNINTDIISPPQYMEYPIEEAAKYSMSAVRPDFYERMSAEPGTILVAGSNFGSGSSRETSPLTLRYLGTGAIVAKFFARIFYRNSINLGIPVIECRDTDRIDDGDEIRIDIDGGRIQNLTKNEEYECSTIPPHVMKIIEDGGLVENLRKYLSSR